MGSIYNTDGSWRITVVDGSTRTGLYAADGSYNVVISDGVRGPVNHPCGAYRVTPIFGAGNGPVGFYAPDGSIYVTTSSYNIGAQKVTIVSGNLIEPLDNLLDRLGFSANKLLVLDAGSSDSYAGTGQSFLDLSGNGYDFFLGADGSATASDPTFHGSAGSLTSSEYFSTDAGDYFTYDTTNETWMQNLHKDNAIVAMGFWVQIGSTGGQSFFGNNAGSLSNTGFCFNLTSSSVPTIIVSNGSGTAAANRNMGVGNALSAGVWTFVGISYNEATGANGMTWAVNGTTVLTNSAYTSPASGNATFTTQIAARGNNSSPLTNNSRLAMAFVLNADIGATGLKAIFNATRGRFGV